MTFRSLFSMSSHADRPHALPVGLLPWFLLLAFTHLSTLLINQSPAYWQDVQYVDKSLPFYFLLLGGPWVFIAIILIYLFGLWLGLRRANALWGILFITFLSYPHMFGLMKAFNCGWAAIHEAHSKAACQALRDGSVLTFYIIYTAILLGSRLPAFLRAWVRRLAISVALVLPLVLVIGLTRAALPPAFGWRPVVTAHTPGPRYGALIVYDSFRQRAVLFGGISHWNGRALVYDNSTWEWDGVDWTEIKTPVSPPGRLFHAMAYDEARGKIVLYGGTNRAGGLTDLWEYDGKTWKRGCPVCNPAPREGAQMFFDPQLQKIILYGGLMEGTGYPEAWSWDGSAWQYVEFDTSAPGLYYTPLIYQPQEKRAISLMDGDYGGTWVWQGKAWSKLELSHQPPLRRAAMMVYVPDQNYTIFFGGSRDDSLYFDDTWALQGDTWTQLTMARFPHPLYLASAFYDPIRKSILVYGGEYYGKTYMDMWELLPPGDINHE